MKIYHKSAFVISFIVCILLMASCQKDDSSTTPVVKDSSVTLTFGHHESALPPSGILQDLAKDFEAETGIHIKFEEYPDAQWRDLLKAKLLDGSAPDIFAVDTDPLSLYDKINPDINCIDLTSEEFVPRMDKEVLPAISCNNKVYGITFNGKKIWVYSYNKEIFKKLNLEIPTTYEELKNVCQTIKDAGITPMWQVPASSWHQALPLFESGSFYQSKYPDLYDKLNKNETNIKDIPELLTIIKEINEFCDLGFYGNDFLGNSLDEDMQLFADGKVAMALELIGWPSQVVSEHPQMRNNIGIFVMPWADNQIIGINPASNAYFGNANSAHKEKILQFFRFLAEHDNLQKRIDEDPNTLEICWPEIEDRYPEEYIDYLSKFKTGIVMQTCVSYIDNQWMEVGEDIEKMFADLMTPEEVLNEISIRRDELAKIAHDKYWQ